MTKRTLRIKSSLFILAFLASGSGVGIALASGPSFDCSKAQKGSIEELICQDEKLSELDRKMTSVYGEAAKKAINEHPPVLRAEQRGWIKGRNDCWKSTDRRECVDQNYRRRIAELQARYRLVPADGPFWYSCDGDPRNEVVVTFFKTDPPTLEAERGDQVSLMYLEPSGSGSKYQGRNESFWEHQGEATIVWGYGSPKMRCSKRPSAAQLTSTVGATHPPTPLADLPVVDMERVDPAKYRAASDLAARGSAPLDIVLKIVGTFGESIFLESGGRRHPDRLVEVFRLMSSQNKGEKMSDTEVLDKTFHFILKRMVDTGQAPHYTEIAAQLGVAPEDGRKTMHTLFESRIHGWLYPHTDLIASFAPFNNQPTQFRVTIEGQQKWFAQ